jgi:asparagine synthase (glutamine-hydrolysing)
MSGIAVIWNRDGRPVDTEVMVQMTRSMEHRGPDHESHWSGGFISFGHRALNVTPESRFEKQPLVDEAGSRCIAFDGRIDNRAELQTLLPADGSIPQSETDAKLVLRAFGRWGEDCPSHLLGDFAFAIWDGSRNYLFCARDPLGVRPLFYANAGNTFVCASEIRSLFALPALKKEPELGIVTARLLRKYVEFDETLYKGVSRLPLAHCMIVTRNAIRQNRYWDIDPNRQIRYRSDDEYAEHFHHLFFEAVRCRLRSSQPIAGLLSGGLDSSGIVCAAQRIRKEEGISEPKFEAFSMVFDVVTSSDERAFINEVLRSSEVRGNFYVGDRNLREGAIDRHVLYPGTNYSPLGMILGSMLRQIRAANFRVLLEGTGGDELAGDGFQHKMTLMKRGKWLSLAAGVNEYAAAYGVSPWSLVLDVFVKPSIPSPIKTAFKLLTRTNRKPMPGLARADALRRTGAADRIAEPPVIPRFGSPVHSQMYLGILGRETAVLSESYEALFSSSGLEMRQPFRDRRLAEFAMALPLNQLWRDGWSRIAFRNAMKQVVPGKVLKRRGKGIFQGIYDSVLAGTQAKEVRALFENSVLVGLGLADAEVLRNLLKRYQNAPEISLSPQISDLVALELRCRDILGEPSAIVASSEFIRPAADARINS